MNVFLDQEPAFQELILLYTKEVTESDTKDKAEVPSLQLKIYERIPIPDLPVNTSKLKCLLILSCARLLFVMFQALKYELSN